MTESIKRYVFRSLLALVIVAALATVCFIGNAVVLRVQWRDLRHEINGAFSAAHTQGATMEYGGVTLKMGEDALNYYHAILFNNYTTAYKRGNTGPTAESTFFYLPGGTLVFTPKDGGDAVHIQWTSDGGTKGYYLRGQSYSRLGNFFSNCVRNAQTE